MDNKTIAVKFHRGLDPCIQDAVATMTSRCPFNKVLFQWYNANKALQSSYHVPTSNPIPTDKNGAILDR